MDPKVKKGLFIGCTIAVVLLVSCCILSVVLTPYLGKKFIEEGVPWMMKKAIAEDLPEGVDQDRVNKLIDSGWDQIMQQGYGNQIDQIELDELLNQDIPDTMEDDVLTPDEFDFLIDRFNEVLFESSKDPDAIESLKESYRNGKADEELTPEEINDILEKMEEVLASKNNK